MRSGYVISTFTVILDDPISCDFQRVGGSKQEQTTVAAEGDCCRFDILRVWKCSEFMLLLQPVGCLRLCRRVPSDEGPRRYERQAESRSRQRYHHLIDLETQIDRLIRIG